MALQKRNLVHEQAEPNAKPISFIENKPMNFKAIEKLLSDSQQKNHWANYGPASIRLEEFLHQKLHLPRNKNVIMCKSGTSALHTLVQLEELKAKRRLNWVISSFGFIASNVGCLSDAHIIDCDKSGMLSIEQLQALPESSWDGVVITNIFGLARDITAYEELCNQLGKKLIVDNAVGLFSSWRHSNSPNESISFHQTKPWGVGEGGCVIVDEIDAELVRDMISFGRGRNAIEYQFFSNEKLADINAAAIMAWMQQMFEWYPAYMNQAQRIAHIAQEFDIVPLQPLEPNKPYGNVPLLAPAPISLEQMGNQYLQCMKYYHPLIKTPTAADIYSRVINVPSHRELVSLSDIQLKKLFRNFVRTSS